MTFSGLILIIKLSSFSDFVSWLSNMSSVRERDAISELECDFFIRLQEQHMYVSKQLVYKISRAWS